MSFGLTMWGVPYAMTYNQAVALYEKAVPWRKGGDDRPLPGKRSRNYGVRMDGDDVVFRYYCTDVIRWHKDWSYEIDTGGYGSRSTCTFASHFMPHYHWIEKEMAHLRIADTVYAVAGQRISVSETGVVSGSGLGRFKKTTINRKKAKAMLTELGYYPYLAWHKLMHPMVQDTMPAQRRCAYVDECDIAPMLHCADKWHELMMSWSGDPDTMRETLYRYCGREYDIYDHTYYDSVSYTTNVRRYAVVMRGA